MIKTGWGSHLAVSVAWARGFERAARNVALLQSSMPIGRGRRLRRSGVQHQAYVRERGGSRHDARERADVHDPVLLLAI